MATYAGIDNFDSYSDGDLHAENGGSGWAGAWSGSTYFDVQGSVTRSGAKAVEMVSDATEPSIFRQLSAAADAGDIYFSFRRSGADDQFGLAFRSGGTASGDAAFEVKWENDGDLVLIGTTTVNIATGAGTGTWYDIHVNIVSTTTCRARAKTASAGAWGAYSSTVTYKNTKNSFDWVGFVFDSLGGGTPTFYFDEITNVSPVAFVPKVIML